VATSHSQSGQLPIIISIIFMYQVIYKSGKAEREIFLENIDKIFYIFGISQCEFNNFYYNVNPARNNNSVITNINLVRDDLAPKKKIEVIFT
jgi:hypothetical protein